SSRDGTGHEASVRRPLRVRRPRVQARRPARAAPRAGCAEGFVVESRARLLRRCLVHGAHEIRVVRERRGGRVSTVAPFDVGAARARFPSLQRDLVFFDGPGGRQVPDSVIEAVSAYFRDSNANVSGPYETSRRTEELFARSRATAARFLGATDEEIVFGPNMTTLNFAPSRTVGREFAEGDEILVTRLDHDGNVSPWLELAHDKGLVVRSVDIEDDCSLDMTDLER